MCTVPGVLMGPNLASFIASNYALLQPTLVTIPGGTFMMGAGTNYGAREMTISTFQMGRTPVTNNEYARYMEALGRNRYALIGEIPTTRSFGVLALRPSADEVRSALESMAFEAIGILVAGGFGILGDAVRNYLDSLKIVHIKDNDPPTGFDGPRQPVINVNWYEAFVYAVLHGATLPTEGQWEYAARVVQGSEELRDYATPSGRLTHEEAHYGAESTVDVDDPRYPTLPNGLRHMTGNAWEWMLNWHGYPQGEIVDPTRPIKGTYTTYRGGSWYNPDPKDLHAASRDHGSLPDHRDAMFGFRVAAPAR